MALAFFNQLQEFKWHQIFNMTGASMKEIAATGKDAKKRAEHEKYYKGREIMSRIAGHRGSASSSLQ